MKILLDYVLYSRYDIFNFFQISESSCATTSGGAGNCISLFDCTELFNIVNNPYKSQNDIEKLRSAGCGFEGNTPKVSGTVTWKLG